MHARRGHPRRLIAVLAAVTALAAPAASAGVATDDPSGFLRDRPAVASGVRAAGTGEIAHQLICAEDCLVSGRLVISPRDAARLGFAHPSGEWIGVGRFHDVLLRAREWRTLRIPLGRRSERRMRRSHVRVHGEALAVSIQSWRHGHAGWTETYR
jgi:hypothetical protein